MRSVAKLSFQLERAIYLSASPSTGLHYRYGNTRRLIQNCSARWGVSRDPQALAVFLLEIIVPSIISVIIFVCISVRPSVRMEQLGTQ